MNIQPAALISSLQDGAIRPLTALLLLAASTLQAADWPQFRGPSGNGFSGETALPTTLNIDKDLAWKADLPGRGLSSPIVVGDRVFVTCSSGPKQQRLHVICFSATSGSRLWEREFWATGRTMCYPKSCVAAPSPASDGKRIVAIFSSNDAVCLDLEGNLIWFRGLGRDYPNASNSLGMSSSLLIVDGIVVAQVESQSDGFTVGLDLDTGMNRWKIPLPHKPNWTSPILLNRADRRLVVLLSSSGVAAVEPATGTAVWDYADADSAVPSSVTSGGVLFVPSRRGLTALQPGFSQERPKQLWQSSQLRPGTSSPIVVGEKVFALNDAGILTCGAVASGERLWQLRLKGPFSATPVAVGHFLYCVSEKGVVQVIDTSKPEGQIVSELDLGETILSTPSISGGAIFFRSDARLWKVGKPAAAALHCLQGTWEGAVVGDTSNNRITITVTGNSFHFHRDTNFWFETTIALPAGTDPQQLHATIKKSAPSQGNAIGKAVVAIIKIEDGTLTVAARGDGAVETPNSFEATEDEGLTIYELRKVQP